MAGRAPGGDGLGVAAKDDFAVTRGPFGTGRLRLAVEERETVGALFGWGKAGAEASF